MALKDNYLTVSQAAKELSVTRQTISRWISKKYVPVERIGRVALIKKKDLQKYHRWKLSEAAADSIIALYLATAEDYVREKGYIKADKPVRVEFYDEKKEDNIIYKLSSDDLAQVEKRARPIVADMLKDLHQKIKEMGEISRKK